MLGLQRLADRLEVIAGIQPLGNLADRLTERFEVAQERRASEHVDLSAGVVDVVFAGDVIAGEGEQIGERVAEHGATAMADMHRAGRIGRHVLDIDLVAAADRAAAIGRALRQHRAQLIGPDLGLQRQIDEARPGDLDLGHHRLGAQFGGDLLGEIARLGLGFLGQHHRGIGRHVAMGRVLGRLHHHARQIETGGQRPLGGQRLADGLNPAENEGEQMRRGRRIDHGNHMIPELAPEQSGWMAAPDGRHKAAIRHRPPAAFGGLPASRSSARQGAVRPAA